MKLQDKTALVTGGGSGIGREIALLFAAEGARVMVADIDEEAARAVAGQIQEGGGSARALRVDVSAEADVQGAIATVVEAWGSLDILVNNAGIGGPGHPWDRVIAVNLSGVYYGCLHGLQQMLRQDGGVIVNMASVAGLGGARLPNIPGGFGYAYTSAKHGVIGLTRQFALDGAPSVRVNCVCPGWIDTPLLGMLKQVKPMLEWVEAHTPLGRLGRPEEVARGVLFLASEDSSFMTGAFLVLDGGWTVY